MIWDRVAPFYDLFMRIKNKDLNERTRLYVANLCEGDDRVLECACGTGIFTGALANKCKEVVATDFSYGMLKKTYQKHKKHKNILIEFADITDLRYEDNAFDKVIAANVVHLLKDPEAGLAEMTRVCKNGGKLIIPNYAIKSIKGAPVLVRLMMFRGMLIKNVITLVGLQDLLLPLSKYDIDYKVFDGNLSCIVAVVHVVK